MTLRPRAIQLNSLQEIPALLARLNLMYGRRSRFLLPAARAKTKRSLLRGSRPSRRIGLARKLLLKPE
jgi:hypothetical protein